MPDLTGEAETARVAKIAVRNQMLTARSASQLSVRTAAAASIQASTLTWVRTTRPTVCAAYAPVGSEPGGVDLPDVLVTALPPGGRLLLPVLRPDNDLDWAVYNGSLTPGPYGLRQPAGPRLGVHAVRAAALVIVPALAVSRTGMRLGRGGGSYDRALGRAGSALTVALLHDGELVDHLPAEPHDRPVRAAITPADGLVMLSPAPGWTK